MSISFGGVGELCVTFKTAGTVTKGSPVKVTANGTVATCANGERFMGFAIDVTEDGYCTVQINGYTTVKYTGTAPTVGYSSLSANGSGGVKSVTSGGSEFLVLNVDSASTTVGFIL